MTKYVVHLEGRCNQTVVVNASSEDEARDFACAGENIEHEEEMEFGNMEDVYVQELITVKK